MVLKMPVFDSNKQTTKKPHTIHEIWKRVRPKCMGRFGQPTLMRKVGDKWLIDGGQGPTSRTELSGVFSTLYG